MKLKNPVKVCRLLTSRANISSAMTAVKIIAGIGVNRFRCTMERTFSMCPSREAARVRRPQVKIVGLAAPQHDNATNIDMI